MRRRRTLPAKPAAREKDKLSIQEALVYVMFASAAIDRRVKEVEIERISTVVRYYPVFRGFDENALPALSAECGEVLTRDPSLRTLLDMVEQALPKRFHETAYALGVEVAAADLKGALEEIKLLDHLADRFNIDRLMQAAIERSATARHEKM